MTILPGLNSGLEAAYLGAAQFRTGTEDINRLVRNSTLVPHLIEDTDLFWYRRYMYSGFQFRLVNAKSKVNQLAAVRQLAGPGIAIKVDSNQGWTCSTRSSRWRYGI